uniref:Uncharacterized protein n=1 Tax=Lotharella oceanica TaxID=641309 RepID=A0A7S2U5G6_9EUKA|mmetsp:Transcript_9820/g.18850  ORF Transcript_9820/g.18850 Transcript_9820/m.18850 type:complete len:101 (+) Transcript_9820:78-380(+)
MRGCYKKSKQHTMHNNESSIANWKFPGFKPKKLRQKKKADAERQHQKLMAQLTAQREQNRRAHEKQLAAQAQAHQRQLAAIQASRSQPVQVVKKRGCSVM